MNETTQPIGPGERGHDSLRVEAIPEAATQTLLLFGLLMWLGFIRTVTMTADEIVAESATQLVFARRVPLRVGAIAVLV